MSLDFSRDTLVYVREIDDFVNLSQINRLNEVEERERKLEAEWNSIGEIHLFANNKLSSYALQDNNINPETWRWAQHLAKKSLSCRKGKTNLENKFVRELLVLGRSYALSRYASVENHSRTSTSIASLTHGIRALLHSYIESESTLSTKPTRTELEKTLNKVAQDQLLTGYEKTAIFREAIHNQSQLNGGAGSHLTLNKNSTRRILSLTRLFFLLEETQNINDFLDVSRLQDKYEYSRKMHTSGTPAFLHPNSKAVKNWSSRHRHSIIHYFPFALRGCIARGIKQTQKLNTPIESEQAINEMTLMRCSISRIPRSKNR